MIVSFRHRFIFVAIPKTATHAFRVTLRPQLGPRDWEQCVLFEPRYFPVEPLAQIGHGHITCRELQPFLLPGLWETFFRFCTVRNPFDRFVSCCYFLNRENRRMQNQPLDTMKQIILNKQAAKEILLRPQSEFVIDEHGQLIVDYVCRFEALQDHFDSVCRQLKIPSTVLPRINAGSRPIHPCCYDRELEELVRTVYKEDFALFNYPVDRENG